MGLHARSDLVHAKGPGACCLPHMLLFSTDHGGTRDMLAAAMSPSKQESMVPGIPRHFELRLYHHLAAHINTDTSISQQQKGQKQ